MRFELEIGSSHGELLKQLASENPDRFFVGVDIDVTKCHEARQKLEIALLSNAQVVTAEAHAFVRSRIPDRSLSAVHIYFPTPYPRALLRHGEFAKHIRSRLINSNFLIQLRRVLAPAGSVRIVTDHEEYFADIAKLIDSTGFLPTTWTSPIRRRQFDTIVGTGCERGMRRAKKTIFYLQCVVT